MTDKDQLEWLWANCKIVYWPKNWDENDPQVCDYPIEHNTKWAKKYGRDMIEEKMKNDLTNGN